MALGQSSDGDDQGSKPQPVQERAALQPGAVVVDREQEPAERDPAVVMSRPPVPAEQWALDHIDGTLADDNPDYPADARTVIVIYRERFEDTEEYAAIPVPDTVREKLRDGDSVSLAAASNLCKFYAFPEARLEPTGDCWPPTPATDDEGPAPAERNEESVEEAPATADVDDRHEEADSIDLSRLAAVMREAGFEEVEQNGDYVTAMKLDEPYHVDSTGTVMEGGALADKLASFIDKHYVQEPDS